MAHYASVQTPAWGGSVRGLGSTPALKILKAVPIAVIAGDAQARAPIDSAAAVVVAYASFNPQHGHRQPALVLMITGISELPGPSSTSKGESISSLVGMQLHHWHGGQTPLYTDCRSLVMGTTQGIVLSQGLETLGDSYTVSGAIGSMQCANLEMPWITITVVGATLSNSSRNTNGPRQTRSSC